MMNHTIVRTITGAALIAFVCPTISVARLPVAAEAGGPYVEHTIENVQNRTYPLYNEAYFFTGVKPGTKMNPLVREFIRSQPGRSVRGAAGRQVPAAHRPRGARPVEEAGSSRAARLRRRVKKTYH